MVTLSFALTSNHVPILEGTLEIEGALQVVQTLLNDFYRSMPGILLGLFMVLKAHHSLG